MLRAAARAHRAHGTIFCTIQRIPPHRTLPACGASNEQVLLRRPGTLLQKHKQAPPPSIGAPPRTMPTPWPTTIESGSTYMEKRAGGTPLMKPAPINCGELAVTRLKPSDGHAAPAASAAVAEATRVERSIVSGACFERRVTEGAGRERWAMFVARVHFRWYRMR